MLQRSDPRPCGFKMTLRDELKGFIKPPDAFFGIPAPTGHPDVAVLGIPYDHTSSYYPGCRFGPSAIRRATTRERSHSEPLSIGQESRYVEQRPLSEMITLEDVGDLDIDNRLPEMAYYDISDAVYRLTQHPVYVLFIGGDHFVTYPLLRGVKRGRPAEYGLVWLDAHADMYGDYDGDALSHATTLRRIIDAQLVDINNIVAYDLRSALSEHRAELVSRGMPVVSDTESLKNTVRDVAEHVDYLYITVDLDVLRAEQVPGVSHPESGGVDILDLLKILRGCFVTQKVQYADIVEFNPLLDHTGTTSVMARDIVKEILTGFALQLDHRPQSHGAESNSGPS